MHPDRLRHNQGEIDIQTTHTVVPLGEILVSKIADPAQLRLAQSNLHITKKFSPQTHTSEYITIIDKQLGPQELQAILEGASSQKKNVLSNKTNIIYLRQPSFLEDIYWNMFPQPVPPGFQDIGEQIKRHSKQLLTVLQGDTLTVDAKVGKPFAFLPTLEMAQQALFENVKHSPSIARQVFIDAADDEVFKTLSRTCNIPLFYEVRESIDGDKSVKLIRNKSKNKIMQRLFHERNSTSPFDLFFSRLSPDQIDDLVKSYALTNYQGYTIPLDNDYIKVIFGKKEMLVEKGESTSVAYDIGNYSLDLQINQADSSRPGNFVAIPTHIQMKEYCIPLLHWKKKEDGDNHISHQWDLAQDQSSLSSLGINPQQYDITRVNPLVGLTTLLYMNPDITNSWVKDMQKRDVAFPHSISYFIPFLAAANQINLLNHEIISTIEEIMK